eukprot:Amastigsp_a512159_38.p2 type:complete len:194 gc:universal Amastigsp_a512159_38:31-612(+)
MRASLFAAAAVVVALSLSANVLAEETATSGSSGSPTSFVSLLWDECNIFVEFGCPGIMRESGVDIGEGSVGMRNCNAISKIALDALWKQERSMKETLARMVKTYKMSPNRCLEFSLRPEQRIRLRTLFNEYGRTFVDEGYYSDDVDELTAIFTEDLVATVEKMLTDCAIEWVEIKRAELAQEAGSTAAPKADL